MRAALKHAGQAMAGLAGAALVVRLAVLGVAAIIVVAVAVIVAAVVVVIIGLLARGLLRWILESGERSDRASRMMLAGRGNATCLQSSGSVPPPPCAP